MVAKPETQNVTKKREKQSRVSVSKLRLNKETIRDLTSSKQQQKIKGSAAQSDGCGGKITTRM